MQPINNFIKKSVIGGLLVVLPIIILFAAFRWVFRIIASLIEPLTQPIVAQTGASVLAVDLLVILLILVACFIVGSVATTRVGVWLHNRFDHTLARLAPGYNLVRDIIHQVLGDSSNSPFKRGEVAKARLFGADIATEVTCIVTSHHDNGWFSVFVPTGPNPTSGLIYHLPADQVELIPTIKVDEALRSIIACGAGSAAIYTKAAAATSQPPTNNSKTII